MPQLTDYNSHNPSPDMVKRGREFGAWFRTALHNADQNPSSLAAKLKISKSTTYALKKDCIGPDGRYRKPSEGMIKTVARGLNANEAEAMRIMGYDVNRLKFGSVPDALTNLAPDKQQALAQLVEMLSCADEAHPTTLKAGDKVYIGESGGRTLELTNDILKLLEREARLQERQK